MVSIKQQLNQKIIECKNSGIDFQQIYDREFIHEMNLNDLWKKRENKNDDWESFVRFVLFEEQEKQYISERLMQLQYEALDALKNFVISTDDGNFSLPDRLSLFLRLRSLFRDFFKCYRKIMSRINFDYPQREFSENQIRGKIDWNKTSRNSLGQFPVKFYTKSWIREFDTPENILLLLAANWIKIDSSKILISNLKEPLSQDEKAILIKIHNSIDELITHFPFSDVTRRASQLTIYSKNTPKINHLRREVNKRIREGKIKNSEYGNLLKWVGQYLDLSIEGKIHSKNTFVAESMTSIDTLYEYLIFFEFFIYLKNEIKCNPKIMPRIDGKNTKYTISFRMDENLVELHHDMEFSKDNSKWPNWILTSRPDFTAIVDNKIIAVFDAKNYFRVTKELQEKHDFYKKTLKGLKGLKKLNKGNIISHLQNYPNISKEIEEYWKKFQEDNELAYEFCDKLIEEFESNNEKSEKEFEKLNTAANDRRKEATIKILSYVTNLDVNYGGIIFPKEEYKVYEFKNKKKPNHIPRFHHDLKFEYLQMDYDPRNAISTRNDTVEKMYDAIKFAIKSQPQKITV